MTKYYRLLLIALVPLFVLSATMAVSAENITFYTHSSEQQTFIDDGQVRGIPHAGTRAFQVELIRQMMLIRGVNTGIVDVPFARGYTMVKEQNDIAFFSLARTWEREQQVKWGSPLKTTELYFYELKQSPTHINSISDAKKVFSIGVMRGGVQESTLDSLGFENYYAVNSYAQILSMLELGRLSLIVGSADFTEHPVSKRDQQLIKNTRVALTKHETYLVFSKNVDDLEVERWRRAHHKLKLSGQLDALRRKYLLPRSQILISENTPPINSYKQLNDNQIK